MEISIRLSKQQCNIQVTTCGRQLPTIPFLILHQVKKNLVPVQALHKFGRTKRETIKCTLQG
jgi:hypothetical protein